MATIILLIVTVIFFATQHYIIFFTTQHYIIFFTTQHYIIVYGAATMTLKVSNNFEIKILRHHLSGAIICMTSSYLMTPITVLQNCETLTRNIACTKYQEKFRLKCTCDR